MKVKVDPDSRVPKPEPWMIRQTALFEIMDKASEEKNEHILAFWPGGIVTGTWARRLRIEMVLVGVVVHYFMKLLEVLL